MAFFVILSFHIRHKIPFENTPIFNRQSLIYPVCRHMPNSGFELQDVVRWSWLSAHS